MTFVWCLNAILLFQITLAQVIPYAQRNGIPLANIYASAQPQNVLATANMAMSPQLANMPANAIINALSGNANAEIVNAINENAAIVAASQDVADAITNANLATVANTNLANGIGANLAALASANLASINGNMATFDFGNGFSLTSGSPSSPGFGIQVLADGLEVGGKVAVNGQMPIFGTVAINGHVPTDGSATVSYSCGSQAAE